MKFDLPKERSSIIKVIGVGGGGSNAVNHMYKQGIDGVDFIICNTDAQVLDTSPVPVKVQLGKSLTQGLGAGSKPDMGKNAAIESIDEIRELLGNNTKMLFITAGMGGGTGTGASPVIAEAAREMDILTVGIVTIPFTWEGPRKRAVAAEGIEALRQHVDTLLIVNNDKLREIYGNLPVGEAFAHADDVLTIGAKGIAEIITRTGYINVDFEDVKTVMTNSGVAIMGSAMAEGEGRAIKAVEAALASPLLNDNVIKGAKNILLNITFGNKELLMDEITDITDYIKNETQSTDDVIWGYGKDDSLDEQISVTIIATGFETSDNPIVITERRPEIKRMKLHDEEHEESREPQEKQPETDERIESDDGMYIKSIDREQDIPKGNERADQTLLFDDDIRETESLQDAEISWKDMPRQTDDAVEKKIPEEAANPDKENDSGKETDRETQAGIQHWTERLEPEEEEEASLMTDAGENNAQTIEFDLENNALDEQHQEDKDPLQGTTEEMTDERQEPTEEQKARARERISKLRELSLKLRTPSGISDLENEPAYKRKNIKLDEPAHSSESEISRFTLSESEEEDENGNKKTNIKPNNSFLHDNVD